MAEEVQNLAQEKPKLSTQVSYGFGQIAGQVFRDIPSFLLLFFLTNVVGIEPAIAGTAIFAPKLIMGVGCDLTVGVLSDKWRRRFAWHNWLLAGAIIAPIAMIMLFRIPAASQNLQIAYIVVVFSFYMAAFAIFSVPYLAIASTLTTNPHQRTVLMGWRLAFTAIGVLIASGLAPAYASYMGGDQSAYQSMAILLAVISSVSLMIAYFGSRRVAAQSAPISDPEVALSFSMQQFWSALSQRRFAVLLGVNILQLAGAGMAYAAMLYFLIYNMGRADAFELIGLLVLLTSAGIILAQPLWVGLSKRFGKRPVYVFSTLLYATALLGYGASPELNIYSVYFFAFLLGVGNSGWAMLGFSIVSDIAAEGNGGIYSAVWVAADKVGFALGGTLLVGIVLSTFGFSAANAVAGLPQSASAITGILFAFAVIPAAMNIVAACIFGRWGKVA